jgi:hypothetical protein
MTQDRIGRTTLFGGTAYLDLEATLELGSEPHFPLQRFKKFDEKFCSREARRRGRLEGTGALWASAETQRGAASRVDWKLSNRVVFELGAARRWLWRCSLFLQWVRLPVTIYQALHALCKVFRLLLTTSHLPPNALYTNNAHSAWGPSQFHSRLLDLLEIDLRFVDTNAGALSLRIGQRLRHRSNQFIA